MWQRIYRIRTSFRVPDRDEKPTAGFSASSQSSTLLTPRAPVQHRIPHLLEYPMARTKEKPPVSPPLLLRRPDVCRLLNCSPSTLSRLIKAKLFPRPTSQLGIKVWTWLDVEQYVERLTQGREP